MIFMTHDQNTKFSHAFCVLVSLALTMALYRYFNRLTMSYTLPQDIFQPLLVCVKIHSAQLNVLQAFNAPLWLVSINLLLVFLHRPVLGYKPLAYRCLTLELHLGGFFSPFVKFRTLS